MPLDLSVSSTQENVEPTIGVHRIDDLPVKPHHPSPPKPHRPLFSSNFSFGAPGAAPSPPPSAGIPHARPRTARSKSPSSSSARSSMLVEDEDTEWDTSKLLPQFQNIRRPSLLTPPTTSDVRRSSYDKNVHLGYDDGSTELVPPGRRSSVPTHHLRPESSPDRGHHAGFRRSSLATTSITRRDMEGERTPVETLSEVDSAEEELAADNSLAADLEDVETQTAELHLDDSKVPQPQSLKRDVEEMEEPTINSAPHTPIPNPIASLNHIPYPYVAKRLLDMGPYFVGHDATAQAYVEAIQYDEKNSLYKVEVVPRDNKTDTFRIVKRYKYTEDSDSESSPPPDSPIDLGEDEVEYTSPSLPVHVEYAVFRLPLLGSMLLSGQVFCGDTLRIPLPYPEVWTAVVGWMYTNKVVRLPGMEIDEQAEMVKECIQFLGGRV
jgi:hypothetical protein